MVVRWTLSARQALHFRQGSAGEIAFSRTGDAKGANRLRGIRGGELFSYFTQRFQNWLEYSLVLFIDVLGFKLCEKLFSLAKY